MHSKINDYKECQWLLQRVILTFQSEIQYYNLRRLQNYDVFSDLRVKWKLIMKNEEDGTGKGTGCKVRTSFILLAKDFFPSSDIYPELNLHSQLLPLKSLGINEGKYLLDFNVGTCYLLYLLLNNVCSLFSDVVLLCDPCWFQLIDSDNPHASAAGMLYCKNITDSLRMLKWVKTS